MLSIGRDEEIASVLNKSPDFCSVYFLKKDSITNEVFEEMRDAERFIWDYDISSNEFKEMTKDRSSLDHPWARRCTKL